MHRLTECGGDGLADSHIDGRTSRDGGTHGWGGVNLCQWILEQTGYKTFASRDVNDMQVFGVDGSNGVWIGGPCNGITLMFLFAIFVIAYPGSFKNKLWYVPLGILIVHIINIIRIIVLALIANYNYYYLDFNHTYTFTFLHARPRSRSRA